MSAPVEEVRLSLPYIELAAHLFGPEDGLPVIALHGWLDNANSFARLAPKLQGVRIVALDMAGHGHSAHRPAGAGYALWDYVFDVLQVAEQLGWKRFALLGHSLGAIVSLVLAGALPERVTHLGLIDGVVPPTAAGENAAERLGMVMATSGLGGETEAPSCARVGQRAAMATTKARASSNARLDRQSVRSGTMRFNIFTVQGSKC